MRLFQQFVKELFTELWALLSCAVFTALGFYAALTNQSNQWIVKSMVVLACVLALVAFYRIWRRKQRELEGEHAKIPVIMGEFSDVKLSAQREPPANYVFEMYVACGKHPITVKGIKINLYDMNDKQSETIMGNMSYRNDTGMFSGILDLTPGKGRPAIVTFTAQQSFAYTTRMEVFIVDAFGNEHSLAQKGNVPFPFQRFK
jgi:hypothetical protein